jgi:hypothetical protein
MIIYMNIKTNNMNIELTIPEITQLKELIFDEVDKVGGLDLLNPRLYDILVKLSTREPK